MNSTACRNPDCDNHCDNVQAGLHLSCSHATRSKISHDKAAIIPSLEFHLCYSLVQHQLLAPETT